MLGYGPGDDADVTGEGPIDVGVSGVDEQRPAAEVDELLLGGDDDERVVPEARDDPG